MTKSVVAALVRLGYGHPIGGRPLPGDPRPHPAGGVDAVCADLARYYPHRRQPMFPPRAVAALVDRFYLGVTPWPFAALVDAR